MMRKAGGSVLIGLGVVLVLAGLGLAGYNLWDENRAGESAQVVLEELAEQMPELVAEETLPQETSQAIVDATLPPEEIEYPDHILNPNMDMPVGQVDGMDYVGVLEIPAVGITLPILSQWSNRGARVAPCRYSGSAYLDDMVIAGHNYGSHFGSLDEVSTGDLVRFTDMDGNVFTYEVIEFEVLQPDQIEDMCTGDWDLTLFTCTIGGRTRFTVRCERIEQ